MLLREIAAAIEAPEAFLSKIFQTLRASGIVRSHRGTSRGYGLARDAKEISLYDIVLATEGSATLHTSALMAEEAPGAFSTVWRDVEELIADKLRKTMIGDLVSRPMEGADAEEEANPGRRVW